MSESTAKPSPSSEPEPIPSDESNSEQPKPQPQPPSDPQPDDPTLPLPQQIWNVVWGSAKSIFLFFVEVLVVLAQTLRALILVIIRTPYMLVPSIVHTSKKDEEYNKRMKDELYKVLRMCDLALSQQEFIKATWIEQITWTDGRATRERDAHELIRWWQIILGVLIPVIVNLNFDQRDLVVSVAGVAVAVLTAIYQFRRPEDRWRHYRRVNEQYINEIWSYASLCGEHYQSKNEIPATHTSMFSTFNGRMLQIKQSETEQFFGEIVAPAQRPIFPFEDKPIVDPPPHKQ